MGIFSFLGSGRQIAGDSELPEIYPLVLTASVFMDTDIQSTYTKILTDVLERTHGIPDKLIPLLWDNCVQSESTSGLISFLVQAMLKKADLFIVYNRTLDVIRLADSSEQQKIREDYKKSGESKVGVFLSFKNYRRTDMLLIYSALEYCVLASLHKNVNLAKAVQLKMRELRGSVALSDAGVAIAQAKAIAEALRNGRDIFIDAGDEITTATPNIDPTKAAIGFLDAKRAFVLDLPVSYVTGEQTSGIGSTGEADMRAVERGLKQYYFSIVRPVLKALFNLETEFKSQDFRTMTTALEALKTFELVSDEVLSKQSKREITARLFDIDPEAEEKALEAEAKEREENPPEDEVPEDDAQPPQGKQPFQKKGNQR